MLPIISDGSLYDGTANTQCYSAVDSAMTDDERRREPFSLAVSIWQCAIR